MADIDTCKKCGKHINLETSLIRQTEGRVYCLFCGAEYGTDDSCT